MLTLFPWYTRDTQKYTVLLSTMLFPYRILQYQSVFNLQIYFDSQIISWRFIFLYFLETSTVSRQNALWLKYCLCVAHFTHNAVIIPQLATLVFFFYCCVYKRNVYCSYGVCSLMWIFFVTTLSLPWRLRLRLFPTSAL